VVIEQWLAKFDPANLSVTVLVFFVLATGILFLWTRFWPWWTGEAWPARQRAEQMRLEIETKQEQNRQELMAGIRDALVELRVLVRQNREATDAIAERLSMLPVSRAVRNRMAHNGKPDHEK
jgi:hypothetical protein